MTYLYSKTTLQYTSNCKSNNLCFVTITATHLDLSELTILYPNGEVV